MDVQSYLKLIGCNEIYDDKFQKSDVSHKKLGAQATQQWVNFWDNSLFAYAKGGHRILKGLVERSLHSDEYHITKTPLHKKQYIPITDPLYHFFGGYFSSTFKIKDELVSQYYDQNALLFDNFKAHVHGHSIITTGDIIYTHFEKCKFTVQEKERFLFELFDRIMDKIFADDMVFEEHMCGIPMRFIDAYGDTEFDLDNIIVLDLQRHGVGVFLENFRHLPKDKLAELFEWSSKPSFAYQTIISLAFLKWQRWNSKSLMQKFHNEYTVYDNLRQHSISREKDVFREVFSGE